MQPKIAVVTKDGISTVFEAPDQINLQNLLVNYVLEKKVPDDWTGSFKPTSEKVFNSMGDDDIVAEFFKGNLKESLAYLHPLDGVEPAFIKTVNADDKIKIHDFSRNGKSHYNAEVLYRKIEL